MYEKIKNWISNNRCTVMLVIGVIVFISCNMFSERGKETTNYNNVNRTISELKDSNKRAGELVTGARKEIDQARTDNSRAISNIERAKAITNQYAETLGECRTIIDRSRENNRRAKQILADVEQTNKETAGY